MANTPSSRGRRYCGATAFSFTAKPIAATFADLPHQIYVPIGVLDDADDMAPDRPSYSKSALNWVHLDEAIPQAPNSARDILVSPYAAKDT